ncbi:MAG: flagellar hook-basal body complex protein [Thermoguttaceae bacterium]
MSRSELRFVLVLSSFVALLALGPASLTRAQEPLRRALSPPEVDLHRMILLNDVEEPRRPVVSPNGPDTGQRAPSGPDRAPRHPEKIARSFAIPRDLELDAPRTNARSRRGNRSRGNAPVDLEVARILQQAVTAYQAKLSVIANNLANVETTAFKRCRVDLEDLPSRQERLPGAQDALGNYTSVGIAVGTGIRVAGVRTDFTQGALQETDVVLDLAICGRGFFQVVEPSDGSIRYTRAGNLARNANGDLVMGSAAIGRFIEPAISIPPDATAIVISADGRVAVLQPGSQTMTAVGQIELAMFANPQGLIKVGENLYGETDASGAPTTGTPGQEGLGSLQQGCLEASNVDPEEELLRFDQTAAALQRIRRLLRTR